MKYLAFFLLLYFSSVLNVHLVEPEWELKKEKKGIKVYFKESNNSKIKEVKTVIQVKTNLSKAVMIISEAPRFPEWVYQCKVGKFLGDFTPNDFYFYNLADFPWPLTDREFIFRCITFQDPNTLTVYSNASAVPDKLPLNKKYIRVKKAESNWKLTPLPNGIVEVEYHLITDPGGAIPAWMVNWALDIGPIKSMLKFKEMAESDIYESTQFDFITEP